MTTGFNPVESGIVASHTRPDGNVTGLGGTPGPEIEGKRLELLKEALPKIRRVAFLGTDADWQSPFGQGAQIAARGLGVSLLHAEHTPNDYAVGFATIVRERPDALLVTQSPPNFAQRRLIVGLCDEEPTTDHIPPARICGGGKVDVLRGTC
jgi:putative ABC transport system substrate-binding protein